MTETFTTWDATEHLRTREYARLYLQACADEDPGDGSLIRAALNDVARAGNMAGLARESGMSREGLYKALSTDGNPTFATVMQITRALGMQVRIDLRA
ncbi:MAG: putative addiction module antidote protein [Gammaproteobacteria bacterium]|nr:putative addiction module antidote protein [Gammaproteobacteria bacterium]